MTTTQSPSQYDTQASDFLARFGLSLSIKLSDSQASPPWCSENHEHGNLYTVRISRAGVAKGICFPFWDSINAAQKSENPSSYDVLACISSDCNAVGSFEDFAADFGLNADSLTDLSTYRRCKAFSVKLRSFFSVKEIESLQEIN